MAKVVSQTIVITINKLTKSDGTEIIPQFLDAETVKQLEEVVQQLVGDDSLVVEVAAE